MNAKVIGAMVGCLFSAGSAHFLFKWRNCMEETAFTMLILICTLLTVFFAGMAMVEYFSSDGNITKKKQ